MTTDPLVARAEADPHRPAYHVVPPAGWLNDPNGVGQWRGTYHLFYQYNPHAPVPERIHWGHVSSPDLVRWTDEPVALVPDTAADADGCWSGVLVDDGGTPTMVYSGRLDEREQPCLAIGSPDLRTWTKDPANPVITGPPGDLDTPAFRDHCVWREGEVWRQVIGSGIRGRGGAALLYESPDLRSWTYVGPLVVGDAAAQLATGPDWTGTAWECVDLFGLEDGPDVLVFSAWDDGATLHPLAWTGRYAGDTFEPETLHRFDLGGRYFYAPQSFRDDQGRRIVFGWLQEGRPDDAAVAAGWSGVMSLPRVVTARPDRTLHHEPAGEVATLRAELLHDGPVSPGPQPTGVTGDQLDLELELRLPRGARVELAVRATPDGEEQTTYVVERDAEASASFALDRSRSSLDPTTDASGRAGRIPVDGDRVALRVLVDHSALEAFANGVPLTARAYPQRPDAVGVTLAAQGEVTATLRAWRVDGIWDGPRERWP